MRMRMTRVQFVRPCALIFARMLLIGRMDATFWPIIRTSPVIFEPLNLAMIFYVKYLEILSRSPSRHMLLFCIDEKLDPLSNCGRWLLHTTEFVEA